MKKAENGAGSALICGTAAVLYNVTRLLGVIALVVSVLATFLGRSASATSPFRIQIASDLHTEFYGDSIIPDDIIIPKAAMLALLGDIGLSNTDSLRDFLHRQADRFEKVFFLPGNHEFYNKGGRKDCVEDQVKWMKQVCAERDNLFYMDKFVTEVNGVRILGTTLWSEIPDESLLTVESGLNDYNLVYQKDQLDGTLHRLRSTESRDWHRSDVAWLERELDSSDKPTVILTHHTPSMKGTSKPEYDGSVLSSCFSTDLSRLMRPHIEAWACGHTHFNFDFLEAAQNVRVVSNQRGYPSQVSLSYRPADMIIEVFSK